VSFCGSNKQHVTTVDLDPGDRKSQKSRDYDACQHNRGHPQRRMHKALGPHQGTRTTNFLTYTALLWPPKVNACNPWLHQTVENRSVSDAVTPVSSDRCRVPVALLMLTVTIACPKRYRASRVLAHPSSPESDTNDLEVNLKKEEAKMHHAVVQILVVDDYEPFRRFLHRKLQSRPELQIVSEASDGVQAVRKAEELQPDLILLDIGLPKLNGIEAARQIRKSAPQSRIIFVSQESSPDIVQEAFSLGTCGYVVKSKAEHDLLATVDAVLECRQLSGVDCEVGR